MVLMLLFILSYNAFHEKFYISLIFKTRGVWLMLWYDQQMKILLVPKLTKDWLFKVIYLQVWMKFFPFEILLQVNWIEMFLNLSEYRVILVPVVMNLFRAAPYKKLCL